MKKCTTCHSEGALIQKEGVICPTCGDVIPLSQYVELNFDIKIWYNGENTKWCFFVSEYGKTVASGAHYESSRLARAGAFKRAIILVLAHEKQGTITQ
jgi:hypothetical protein